MNIDKKAAEEFAINVRAVHYKIDYRPGDLLWANQSNEMVIRYLDSKIKPFKEGLPLVNGSSPAVYNALKNKTPFMFLEWAAFDHTIREYRPGLFRSIYVGTDVRARRALLYGMNILISDKVFFLTCCYPYSLFEINHDPRNVIFIRDILPYISRFNNEYHEYK